MSRVSVCSLFFAAGLLSSSPGAAAQSFVAGAPPMPPVSGCEGLPTSLVVTPPLRPLILEMRRRAPTFRRQVARLGDQPGLAVTVGEWLVQTRDSQGARTRLSLEQGRLRVADVQVRTGAARVIVELVAHEFEHILEQLDGIDLIRWIGRSGVYRVGGDSRDLPIETERARRMGRIVASEYAAARADLPCGARP